MSTINNVWHILSVMEDYYRSNDYVFDIEDAQIVDELKVEAETMLAKANIRQLYNELARYFWLPTPAGNMDPQYAIANLWQIAYNLRCDEGVYWYRIYVPFDGEPGVKEYVYHCEATHEWFRDPVDNSLPMRESFHKR